MKEKLVKNLTSSHTLELGKQLQRRYALKCLACLPVAGLVDVAASPKAKVQDGKELPPQPGDRLTYFHPAKQGQIIKLSDIKISAKQISVVPIDKTSGLVRSGSRYNQILLQRFELSELSESTQAISAQGAVAYTAICPHFGCPVIGWNTSNQNYMCPCHQSEFSPKHLGSQTSGPSPRNLPALPLTLEGDEIVVAGEFNDWIGFGKRPRN